MAERRKPAERKPEPSAFVPASEMVNLIGEHSISVEYAGKPRRVLNAKIITQQMVEVELEDFGRRFFTDDHHLNVTIHYRD